MYTHHFGLQCPPFDDCPDAKFFFATPDREEALAAMECRLQYGGGAALTLGDAGVGKTLLIRCLLRRLQPQDRAVVLTCPPNGAMELLREFCVQLGVTAPDECPPARLIHKIRRQLERTAETGVRTVLAIDQAEHLGRDALADVASLVELRGPTGRLLTILVFGQPKFLKTLQDASLDRLRQELYGERTILPLTADATAGYIRHRLHVAGATREDLFHSNSLPLIHGHTGGVPRLINKACDAAMIVAYGAERDTVTGDVVEELIRSERPCPKSMSARDLGLVDASAVFNGLAEQKSCISSLGRAAAGARDAAGTRHDEALAPVDFQPLDATTPTLGRTHAEVKPISPRSGEAHSDGGSRANNSRPQHTLQERFMQADEASATLDGRAGRASTLASELARQVERTERACERAEDLTTRLSSFADQLADRAEELQSRVNLLLSTTPTSQRQMQETFETQAQQLSLRMEEVFQQHRARLDAAYDSQAQEFLKRLTESTRQNRQTVEESAGAAETKAQLTSTRVESAVAAMSEKAAQTFRTIEDRADRLLQHAGEQFDTLLDAIQKRHDRVRDRLMSLTDRHEATEKSVVTATSAVEKLSGRIEALQLDVSHLDKTASRIAEVSSAADPVLHQKLKEAETVLRVATDGHERAAALHAKVAATLVDIGAGCERVSSARKQAEECREIAERLSFSADATARLSETINAQVQTAERTKASLEQSVTRASGCADQIERQTQHGTEVAARLGEATHAAHGVVEQAQAATEAARQATADAAAGTNGLTSAISDGERTLRQISTQGDAAQKTHRALHELLIGADDRLARLGSHQAAMTHVLSEASDATKAAHDALRQISTERAELAESGSANLQEARSTIEALTELLSQADQGKQALVNQHATVKQSAAKLDTAVNLAAEAASGLQDRIEQAIESTRSLQLGCDQAGQGLDRLERAGDLMRHADETRDRLEVLVTQAAKENEELAGQNAQCESTRQTLDEALLAGRALIDAYQAAALDADTTIERLSGQLVELHKAKPDLADLASQVRTVHQETDGLQGRCAEVSRSVGEVNEKSRKAVESARTQTAELERVLAAVKKVFTGLSQASLEAKKQTDTLDAKGRGTLERLGQLAAVADKATQTLAQWVTEAIRVQTRLEGSLQKAPAIAATHPVDRLRELADSLQPRMPSVPDGPTEPADSRVSPARTVPARSVPVRTGVPSKRAEQIAAILQDARQSTGVEA